MHALLIKMNINTSFALLAVLAVVSTVTISSAYAQEESFVNQGLPSACVGCNTEESIVVAEEILLEDVPISVWVDKEEYTHEDMIMLTGYVANPDSAGTGATSQVTIMVRNSIGSIVTIGQIDVKEDKTFEKSLNTAGRLWAYDGVYTINVQQGHNKNKVQVDLVGGIQQPTIPGSADNGCTENDLVIMKSMCVPYTIEGGTVTSAEVNMEDMSLVISIDATDSGILTLTPASSVIDGIFMVLLDNEESNDYMMSEDGTITIPFEPGTNIIEIIGTYVIPEFGTIAVMILAAAIVSIIAISARSRLSIVMPRA